MSLVEASVLAFTVRQCEASPFGDEGVVTNSSMDFTEDAQNAGWVVSSALSSYNNPLNLHASSLVCPGNA